MVGYGTGNVYVSTFAHYWSNQTNPPGVQDVAFQTNLIRAMQWLAGEPVDTSVPANFPTASSISLQDVPPPPTTPGRASPVAVGAYLDGNMPDLSPGVNATGDWVQVDYYPALD